MVKSDPKDNKNVNTEIPEQDESIFDNTEAVEFDESHRAGGTYGIGTKYFQICQNTGKNMEKLKNAGKFVTKNDEGELVFYDSLDVIILDSRQRGTLFNDDGGVACKSYDGKVGSVGGKCKDCPDNTFRGGKCKNSYVLLCTQADDIHAEPFFVVVGASGIRPYKDYARWIQDQKKRQMFSAVTRISTKLEENKHNSLNYVPVFRAISALSPEDVRNLENIRIKEASRFDAPIESEKETEDTQNQPQQTGWRPPKQGDTPPPPPSDADAPGHNPFEDE